MSTDEVKKIIAARLKEARERAELTQEEVHKIMGYKSSGTLSQYEAGDKTPKAPRLKALAELYGVTVNWLYGDTEKKPKDLLKILAQEDFTLNGRIATQEDKDRLTAVIEAMYWDAKEKNKRK